MRGDNLLICVKLVSGKIKRIARSEAHGMVNSGEGTFCPNSEWREQKRAEEKSKKPLKPTRKRGKSKYKKDLRNPR